LKISFRNCVSSLLSTHYRAFLFKVPFVLAKPRAFNPAQKSIGTPKFCLVIGGRSLQSLIRFNKLGLGVDIFVANNRVKGQQNVVVMRNMWIRKL
jgi:hypothetical protein